MRPRRVLGPVVTLTPLTVARSAGRRGAPRRERRTAPAGVGRGRRAPDVTGGRRTWPAGARRPLTSRRSWPRLGWLETPSVVVRGRMLMPRTRDAHGRQRQTTGTR